MNFIVAIIIQFSVVFGVIAWNYYNKYNEQLSILSNYDAGWSARNLNKMCQIARLTYKTDTANHLIFYEIDSLVIKCDSSLRNNLVRSELKKSIRKDLDEAVQLYKTMPYTPNQNESKENITIHLMAQKTLNELVPNQSLHQSP
jgi:hypothetical protein